MSARDRARGKKEPRGNVCEALSHNIHVLCHAPPHRHANFSHSRASGAQPRARPQLSLLSLFLELRHDLVNLLFRVNFVAIRHRHCCQLRNTMRVQCKCVCARASVSVCVSRSMNIGDTSVHAHTRLYHRHYKHVKLVHANTKQT